MNDPVNHPPHYTSSDAKCSQCDAPIECIDVTRHMNFTIGNAIKYLWRHKHKNGVEDLKKAVWYITDEIKRTDRDYCAQDSTIVEQNNLNGTFEIVIKALKAKAFHRCTCDGETHAMLCAWHCRELLKGLGIQHDKIDQ